MTPKELIEAHRSALKDAEASGLTAVNTSTLHSIFDELEKYLTGAGQPNPLELETFRSNLAGSLAYQQHVHTWNLESFKQVIALGQSALKSTMLINGGAAVALLAFLGNLVGRLGSTPHVIAIATSMRMFVFGVFLASVGYAATYFSQLFYSGEKTWQRRTGLALHVIASLVGASALAVFLMGAYAAYEAFLAFAP